MQYKPALKTFPFLKNAKIAFSMGKNENNFEIKEKKYTKNL